MSSSFQRSPSLSGLTPLTVPPLFFDSKSVCFQIQVNLFLSVIQFGKIGFGDSKFLWGRHVSFCQLYQWATGALPSFSSVGTPNEISLCLTPNFRFLQTSTRIKETYCHLTELSCCLMPTKSVPKSSSFPTQAIKCPGQDWTTCTWLLSEHFALGFQSQTILLSFGSCWVAGFEKSH